MTDNQFTGEIPFDIGNLTNLVDLQFKNNELTGFIKSLAYSFPDNSPWETKKGKRVPKLITASMTYQVIHANTPGISIDKLTKEAKVPEFYGFGG